MLLKTGIVVIKNAALTLRIISYEYVRVWNIGELLLIFQNLADCVVVL